MEFAIKLSILLDLRQCYTKWQNSNSMSRVMKTTVVICTRNRKELVEQLLDCLTHQTMLPNQLIVVENTTEAQYLSKSLLEKYFEGKGVSIVYVACQSINIAASRNLSLKHIRGDIAFFIDDDVLFSKNTIQSIVEVFRANKKTNCCCCKFYTKEKSIFAKFACQFFNSASHGKKSGAVLFSPFAFIVFRSSSIRDMHLRETYSTGEDVYFMAQFAAKGQSCVLVPRIKIYHNFLRGKFINFVNRFWQYHKNDLQRYFCEGEFSEEINLFLPRRRLEYFFLPFTLLGRLLSATRHYRKKYDLSSEYMLPIFAYHFIFILTLLFSRHGVLTLKRDFFSRFN